MSNKKSLLKYVLIFPAVIVVWLISSVIFSIWFFDFPIKDARKLSNELESIKYPNSISLYPPRIGLPLESYMYRANGTGNYCIYSANETFYTEDNFEKVIEYYKTKSIPGKNGKPVIPTVHKVDLSEPITEVFDDIKHTIEFVYILSAQDFSDVEDGEQSFFFCS